MCACSYSHSLIGFFLYVYSKIKLCISICAYVCILPCIHTHKHVELAHEHKHTLFWSYISKVKELTSHRNTKKWECALQINFSLSHFFFFVFHWFIFVLFVFYFGCRDRDSITQFFHTVFINFLFYFLLGWEARTYVLDETSWNSLMALLLSLKKTKPKITKICSLGDE